MSRALPPSPIGPLAALVAPPGRDARIDAMRGLALLMIFVNHIPGNPLSLLTTRAWGFSDAAEIFVLLAGISSAYAYGRAFHSGEALRGALAIGSRLWSLYLTHLMLFLVAAALCVAAADRLGDSSHLETFGFDVFLQAPAAFIGDVLRLAFLPVYLDILPLYIVLLGALPLLFLAARVHRFLPLALAAALYAADLVVPLNLPNSRLAEHWHFSPFAWQFLFVIGVTIGLEARAGRLSVAAIGRSARRLLTLVAILFSLAAFLAVAPWREWPGYENVWLIDPNSLAPISKTHLHPLRLIDVLTKFWLFVVLVPAGALWLAARPVGLLATMGRHSLEVFALGTGLSIAGVIAATHFGYHWLAMTAINAAGMLLMLALALMLDFHRRPARGPRAAPSVPASPVAAE